MNDVRFCAFACAMARSCDQIDLDSRCMKWLRALIIYLLLLYCFLLFFIHSWNFLLNCNCFYFIFLFYYYSFIYILFLLQCVVWHIKVGPQVPFLPSVSLLLVVRLVGVFYFLKEMKAESLMKRAWSQNRLCIEMMYLRY